MNFVPVKTRGDNNIQYIPQVMCLVLALVLSAISACGAAKTSPGHQDISETQDMQKNLYSRLFGSDEPRGITWLCYYGQDREVLALPEYDLLILEADALGPVTRNDKGNRMCAAYMSIGEISPNRWFWPLVQNKPWLLEKNPDWPDARRIDPRSPEWSDLLVNTIAPALLAAGYDGFMLDNADIGEYLENRAPEAYAGAREAVANIIRRLRRRFPEAVLIANGALETAADTADCLDAVVCESTCSRWRTNGDGSVSYEEISPQDRAWLRPRLLRLRGAGLPVLALEYVAPEDTAMRQRIRETVKHAGNHPYIAERQLMRFPSTTQPNSCLPEVE
ncbi:endo alpha-1,4 polygalactosaminidase [uncultured Desulfovibrio sp.]|uniref:endo alpha-1,4 polygalactosaminidase n=1 Tax=uncultured Desulfovibrio sp. TaxID=167968 RepID=UPI002804F56A|nr:endo alpha-1,4 polygalactosaminidase [uncultured Desulfovibrio sp.]